ncbi:MAG: hypothetical protein QOE70_4447 [Chthoniobacter sp.]|nr:hypothetical protein [Chthoniobacter sp.]
MVGAGLFSLLTWAGTVLGAADQKPPPPGAAALSQPAPPGAIPRGENHRDGFDADLMHFTDQGSGFFPLTVVRALKDFNTGELYLKNLERFGLVPAEKSERNPDGFPVGIVTNTLKMESSGRTIKMFGFTCAACHTSDLHFGGQTLRVDGGSGLFYVDQLGDQIGKALEKTLDDPEEFFAFLERLVGQPEFDGTLKEVILKLGRLEKDSLLRKAAVRLLHEKVAALAETKALLGSLKDKAEAAAPKGRLDLRQRVEERIKQDAEQFLGNIVPQLRVVLGELDEVKNRVAFLKIRGWLSKPGHRLAGGFGRADDFGTARVELYGAQDERNMVAVNAPVSTPPIWNIDRYAWLHWNANTNSVIQRSIGESIGVGAPKDSVNIVNQMKIEQQVHKLTAPVWPDFFGKPDAAKVARGRELYNSHCAACHNPNKLDEKGLVVFRLFTPEEIGTDPNDAVNFDRPVFNGTAPEASFAQSIASLLTDLQQKAKAVMSPEDRALMDELEKKQTPVKWRDTMKEIGRAYPAKPLEGIWATAPFLHNGSVPTLYHLLRPELRPDSFPVGHKDFDPEHVGFETRPEKIHLAPGQERWEFDTTLSGNRNTGHEYGAELSEEDCLALIEYLKVHRDVWPVPHAAYLEEHADDAHWFTNASNGFSGVPLILLRSLPDLAPEIWGKPEEQFSRFGYLPNTKGPLPLGLSWDSMDPAHPPQPLHPVALTCGACHVGRVRLDDGSFRQLVGAPNTQFDVRRWRRAFEETVHQHLATPEAIEKAAARWKESVAAKPPNYFYRNTGGVTDATEAGERQAVAAKAVEILTAFAGRIRLGELATDQQKTLSYRQPSPAELAAGHKPPPPLDGGSTGQSDGSGDLIPRLLLLDSVTAVGPAETFKTFMATPHEAMPRDLATVTDILSTWQLASRGVAQVDGSVKSPFFRNIAASLAVAGDPKMVNTANAEITARFIGHLPPPPYPFAIDGVRAERGEKLFWEHCSACHQRWNDTVYKTDLIGTDPNRSRVLNAPALALFLRHFVASVPPDYEITDSDGARIKPRELPADSILFDRTQPANQGYVTNALEGVWARAPYLHNGAVPTLYHLLVPAERPAKFARGSASYDPVKVGFQWEIAKLDALRAVDSTVTPYDTGWDSASRLGHDTNLTIDAHGGIVRRGWDGAPREGERRVRLDWSGAENQDSLRDLLEYLKTL